MSASTHWVGSAVSQSVLERGGNAFDAAVAAGFVLHVAEPHLNGPGGDLVALIAPAGVDVSVVCGQGPAPAAATIEHFRGLGFRAVPGAGALAAAVPGAVDAWLLILREFGTWSLRDVLEYAIDYAERGIPLLPRAVDVIASVAEMFTREWPTSAQLWLPGGAVPAGGDAIPNHAYAHTLRRLCDESRAHAGAHATRESEVDAARDVWRRGFVAQEIATFVSTSAHRHGDDGVHHGVMTAADIAGFSAHLDRPVRGRFRDRVVYKAGAWSQGPVLLQALAILDGFDDDALDLDTAAGIHRTIEAVKLAMADREAYYGDRTSASTLATLLSNGYARQRRGQITDMASWELRPGRGMSLPKPYVPDLNTPEMTVSAMLGEPTVQVSGVTNGDTCHLDVVDRWGNMISATPSGGWLQSSPAIPALGFCLGTRLQMTHLDPSSPSALRPRRRPRTTLSPTIVREQDAMVSLGTPGGDQQDQWQLVYLLRTVVGRLSPQTAIEAPMFHTAGFPGSFWPRTWEPGSLLIEDRVPQDVLADLAGRGHAVRPVPAWSLGRLSTVRRTRSGALSAAANPRSAQGYAVGR